MALSFKRFLFIGFKRKVFAMFIIYFMYMMIGAFSFFLLERKNDQEQNELAVMPPDSKLIKRMIDTLRKQNISDEDISSSFDREWRRRSNLTWLDIYEEKVIFSMVLMTTIGYGNVIPKSALGKCVCIMYVFLGIPLNLNLMRLLSLKFRCALGSVLKNAYSSARNRYPGELQKSNALIVLLAVLYFASFSMVFLFGPAALFYYLEDWTYSECVYFSFVSLSTIGLGDYVAGKSYKHHNSHVYPAYVTLMIFWMLFGVAYMLMAFSLLSHLFGLLLLDKLDCKCRQRATARKDVHEIYKNLLKLDLETNRYTPENFTNQQVFQDFLSLCIDNPQDITNENLAELLEAVEDIREKAEKEIELSQLMSDFKHISADPVILAKRVSKTTDLQSDMEMKKSKSNESIKIKSLSERVVTDVLRERQLESDTEALSKSTHEKKVNETQNNNKIRITESNNFSVHRTLAKDVIRRLNSRIAAIKEDE